MSRWLHLIVLLAAAAPAAAAERPNIVFILADDLGYRELGCFGQRKIRTPRLDQLAREGMRLTQHYSGNAVCAPSRCVLMTGKHPGRAFIRNNREVRPEGQFPIPDEEVTLAELLREAGYATGAFGKWGLGPPGSTGDPIRQGFDRFFGYNCQRMAHSYYPEYLWSNDVKVFLDNDPPVPGHGSLPEGADPNDPRSYDGFKGQDYAPDRINEAALEFIRDHRDRPFFLYYPTIIPHLALQVPDEDLEPYLRLGWEDPPFTGSAGYSYTPHFRPRAAYAAMITRMDRYVGRVLDLLDELRLTDNTIVIFSSDNGTTFLDDVDYAFFDSVGELRGLKGSLHEGGVRAPTIVRWPGRTPAGSWCGLVSGFEDWLPTILELVGRPEAIPADVNGMSLAAALEGRPQPPRPFLYREFAGGGGQQFVRVGPWKAIRTNMARAGLELELYHLADDPGERNNLAAERPDVVRRLAAIMEREHVRSPHFPLRGVDPPAR